MEPRVIALDEPTAMLDPQGRTEVITTVTGLCRDKGITIVLITHHMSECIGADRLVVMSNGGIVSDGTPAEVFANVELMEREGLTVPATTRLEYELNRAGFDLPLSALTVDDCAAAIAAQLGKQ
jgi:energy-coupling factor transport system ATP-binding protein